MDESAHHSVDVTLAAIDGGYLVLESTSDKTRFRWPLDKIPRPLEIGSRLTLELQKRQGFQKKNSLANTGYPSTNTASSEDKDSVMRKLLEELVN